MKNLAILLMVTFLTACASKTENYGDYQGGSGLVAYNIDENAYRYHYDKGFTGVDAMGFDSNLQYVWSRVAGAKRCGVAVDTSKIVPILVQQYGFDDLIHKLNGIDFHFAQQKSIENFCTSQRVKELKQVIPQITNGKVIKKF